MRACAEVKSLVLKKRMCLSKTDCERTRRTKDGDTDERVICVCSEEKERCEGSGNISIYVYFMVAR